MNNIFAISDPHLSHKNVLKYSHRPFSSIEEHDETIIENWNEVIRPNDIVIIDGDFSFAGATTVTSTSCNCFSDLTN